MLRFSADLDIPADLLTYYVDRDLAAAAYGGHGTARAAAPQSVTLMHGDEKRRATYEQFFGCPVVFNAPHSELRFDAAALDAPCHCATSRPPRCASSSASCCWRA